LPDLPDGAGAGYVYRRIPRSYLRPGTNQPLPGAFKAKPGQSLSVFRADLRSPREVLQHGIDVALAMAASADDEVRRRGEKQLSDYGATVEEWVNNGCRVARVPVAAFIERGFTLDDPDAQGHQNVSGDYDLYKAELARIAELVTAEECLE
jgi:hypothetical protein